MFCGIFLGGAAHRQSRIAPSYCPRPLWSSRQGSASRLPRGAGCQPKKDGRDALPCSCRLLVEPQQRQIGTPDAPESSLRLSPSLVATGRLEGRIIHGSSPMWIAIHIGDEPWMIGTHKADERQQCRGGTGEQGLAALPVPANSRALTLLPQGYGHDIPPEWEQRRVAVGRAVRRCFRWNDLGTFGRPNQAKVGPTVPSGRQRAALRPNPRGIAP